MRKRTFFTVVIILFLSLIASSTFTANDYVAVVIKARGHVRLFPKGRSKSLRVQKGQLLRDGDRLETRSASFCAIKFLDDKSLLRIKENSSCTIEGKKKEERIEKNIFVEVGTFFASIFKQRGRFLVTTPTSVASVKGTKFWTIQQPSGPTTYIGIEGLIDIQNRAGRVLLKAGQTGIVQSQTTMPVVRLTNPAEIPSLEEGTEKTTNVFDIEFKDDKGNRKTMRIELGK